MNFSDYLTRTFPGQRITSNKRDPNSALGRANPRSYHNAGMAWDVSPSDGMNYQDWLDRIKGDGWNVLEARDEVTNPSPHATGPHWHVAVGGRKEPEVPNYTMGANPEKQKMASDQPQYLADLLQSRPLAPFQEVKPRTWDKDGAGWRTIGIIGDMLQGLGGGQPTYMPAIEEQRRTVEERQNRLQDLIAELQIKRQFDVPEKPGFLRDAEVFSSLSPEQQQQVARVRDILSPVTVSGYDGTYRVPRVVGGGNTKVVNGVTYYNINGEWYDNPEGR